MNDRNPELREGQELQPGSKLERIAAWIDALPPSVKPVLFGPLILIFLMKTRGAFVLGPIVVTLLLVQSDHPLRTFLRGAAILWTLLLASAVGGLIYGVVGRRIKDLYAIGPYIAGSLSVTPYVIALWYVVRIDTATPMFAPFDTGDILGVVLISLVFGSVLGHALLKRMPDPAVDT